jgi:hypothetical protein
MVEAIREVVGVFDDPGALEEAVFALETHGFDRAAFSVLAAPPLLQHAVLATSGYAGSTIFSRCRRSGIRLNELGKTAEPVPKTLSAS